MMPNCYDIFFEGRDVSLTAHHSVLVLIRITAWNQKFYDTILLLQDRASCKSFARWWRFAACKYIFLFYVSMRCLVNDVIYFGTVTVIAYGIVNLAAYAFCLKKENFKLIIHAKLVVNKIKTTLTKNNVICECN